MTQENAHYKTSDTTLAAYLITENFPLLSIDYEKPRFEFLFDDSEKLREVANKYVSGNAKTDPSAFSRVTKKLLRIIHKQIQWRED